MVLRTPLKMSSEKSVNQNTAENNLRRGFAPIPKTTNSLARFSHKPSLPHTQGAGHEAVALHCEWPATQRMR